MRRSVHQENSYNNFITKQQKNHSEKRSFGTDITSQGFRICKIGEKTMNDPLLVGEYDGEIYKMLHNTEEEFRPSHNYMSFQPGINENMRAKLIDWLIDVHYNFELNEETLFLTVNILDRFLDKSEVSRDNLQLIGISCLFIACKYEESFSPEISDFVYVTDNAYTREDVIITERKILRLLDYELTVPTSLRFYERYSRICKFDEYTFNIGLFLIELSLVDYGFLKYKPSTLAGAAVYLSKKILKNKTDTIYAKRNTEESIGACALHLVELSRNNQANHFDCVRKKFLDEKFYEVSKILLRC